VRAGNKQGAAILRHRRAIAGTAIGGGEARRYVGAGIGAVVSGILGS
jgi:hypothetical protein